MGNLTQNIASGLSKDLTQQVYGCWVTSNSDVTEDVQYCSACAIESAVKTDYCLHCGAKNRWWLRMMRNPCKNSIYCYKENSDWGTNK